MKRIAGSLGLLMLAACGSKPLQIVNETDYSETVARSMIEQSLTGLGDDLSMLDDYTFTMRDTVGKLCPANALACTNVNTQSIGVPFVVVWPLSLEASITCHEIIHVYLFKTTGDSDDSHVRQDLFTGYCVNFGNNFAKEPQ